METIAYDISYQFTHTHTYPPHQAACMILRIDDIVSGMKKKK